VDPDLDPSPIEETSSPLSFTTDNGSATASPAGTPPPPLSAHGGEPPAILEPPPPPPGNFFVNVTQPQQTQSAPPGMSLYHQQSMFNQHANSQPFPTPVEHIFLDNKKLLNVERYLMNIVNQPTSDHYSRTLRAISLTSSVGNHQILRNLVEVLSRAPNLTSLQLSSNRLGKTELKLIVEAMAKAAFHRKRILGEIEDDFDTNQSDAGDSESYCHLLTLDLDSNEIGEDGAHILAQFISNYCPYLERLFVDSNRLSSYGVEVLCMSLRDLKNLRELDISSNSEHDAFETVSMALRNLLEYSDSLTHIYCRLNFIGEYGCRMISDGLMDKLNRRSFSESRCCTIDLSDNPFGAEGMKMLMFNPQVWATYVEEIHFAGCALLDVGVELLVRGLLVNGNCFNLNSLRLGCVGMTDSGLHHLCALLPYSGITELDVSDNWDITPAGLDILIQAVEQSPYIDDLSVSNLPQLPHHHSTFRNLSHRNAVYFDFFNRILVCCYARRRGDVDRSVVRKILEFHNRDFHLALKVKNRGSCSQIRKSHIMDAGLLLEYMTSFSVRADENIFSKLSIEQQSEMSQDTPEDEPAQKEDDHDGAERNNSKRICIRVDSS
jgi:Ran GTPase-activating protein (RanGAP) involved in mRNA processing and transport